MPMEEDDYVTQRRTRIETETAPVRDLSVSNSLSGRHWELDQVPAVGDLTDIVQLGTGHHVSAGEGQRRVALQRRVAAYLVGGGQMPRNVASILDSARELGIRDAQHPRSPLAHGGAHRLSGGQRADPLPPRLPPYRRPHPDLRQAPPSPSARPCLPARVMCGVTHRCMLA